MMDGWKIMNITLINYYIKVWNTTIYRYNKIRCLCSDPFLLCVLVVAIGRLRPVGQAALNNRRINTNLLTP